MSKQEVNQALNNLGVWMNGIEDRLAICENHIPQWREVFNGSAKLTNGSNVLNIEQLKSGVKTRFTVSNIFINYVTFNDGYPYDSERAITMPNVTGFETAVPGILENQMSGMFYDIDTGREIGFCEYKLEALNGKLVFSASFENCEGNDGCNYLNYVFTSAEITINKIEQFF